MNVRTGRRFRIKLQHLLIVLSLAVVGVSLSITVTVLYSGVRMLISEKLDAIHKAEFTQIAAGIDDFYDSTGKITAYLQNNKQLIEMIHELEYESNSPFRQSTLTTEINRYLTNLTVYHEAIKGINIVTPTSQYYSRHVLFNQPLEKALASLQVEGIVFYYPQRLNGSDMPVHSSPNMDEESYYVTSLCESGRCYGNVFVLLKERPLVNNADKSNDIMIVDDLGHVLYQGASFSRADADAASLGKPGGIDGDIGKLNQPIRSHTVYVKTIKFHNWKVYYRVENQVYARQTLLLFALSISSFLVCLIISFLLAKWISRRIILPVRRLTSYIKRYHVGDAADADTDSLRRRRQMTLREKLFYYFILTIIVPVGGFIGMFHWMSSSMLSEQIMDTYEKVFEKTAENVAEYMDHKNKLLLGQSYNTYVQHYLQEKAGSAPDVHEGTERQAIHDMMEQYMYLGTEGDFSLYDTSGRLLLSSRFRQQEQLEPEQYRRLQHSLREIVWSYGKDPFGESMLKFSLSIVNLSNLKTIGYAQMEIRLDKAARLYSELPAGTGATFLFDGNGIVGAHHQPDERIVGPLDGERGMKRMTWKGASHFMLYQKLGANSFYLVSLYTGQ